MSFNDNQGNPNQNFGQQPPRIPKYTPAQQTVPKAKMKTQTKLLIIIPSIIFGLATLIILFIVLASILFAGISASMDKPYTLNDKVASAPLSYEYGETTTKERIFGVDASGIRTNMGYQLDTTGATNYVSTESSCHVGVKHGFAPKEFVNTGDDENSTESLLIGYVNDPSITKTIDKTFPYIASDGSRGDAPVKYIATERTTDEGSQYVGVYARVITGGQGIITTMMVVCDDEKEFVTASKSLEKNITFWDTESKY